MTVHRSSPRLFITVAGLAARMIDTDTGQDIEDQPVPYTLTPLAETVLTQPETDSGFTGSRWWWL